MANPHGNFVKPPMVHPEPISSEPFADRLVRPYRAAPWAAGTMVAVAFVVLPLFGALCIDPLAKAFAGHGSSKNAQDTVVGVLVLGGLPTLYLAFASLINIGVFQRLQVKVDDHYRRLVGRPDLVASLEFRRVVPMILEQDAALYRLDRRRHVLRRALLIVDAIATLATMFSGGGGDFADFERRGVRAGQFWHKLIWGVLIFGGVAAGFLIAHPGDAAYLEAVGVFVGLQLVWWVPSLGRSRALRAVDATWRACVEQVAATVAAPVPSGFRQG